MPKILRIINRFNLGGPTYNVALLSKYMPPVYETLLIGGLKDESEASSDHIVDSLGLKPIIIPTMRRSINPLNDIKAFIELVKIIKKYKPDIVHTHAAKSGTLGRLAAWYCRVPIIVHTFHGNVFHSYFGRIKTTIFKFIERWLAAKSTAIIAISIKQKEELVQLHHIADASKITIIPLGFDLTKFQLDMPQKRQRFRSQYNIDDETIAIGIIGRLVPVKNHPFFLKVIHSLQKQTSKKIRAFIVGDGESKPALVEMAGSLGLLDQKAEINGPKVTFTSWIKDIDVVLAGLEIVCMTSFNEGTPVSLIEAQAAGKSIVSTKVGGIEDITLVNQTSFLADVGDEELFVSHLVTLCENPTYRDMGHQLGWNFVKDKFHYTRLINDMDKLYQNLLQNC